MKFLLLIITLFCTCQLFGIDAEVKSISGRPTLLLDGKIHPPMMIMADDPLFRSCVKDGTFNVKSPNLGTVWLIFTKKMMPKDMIIETDIMMQEPTGADAGVLLRVRRSGSKYLIGFRYHGKSRYFRVQGNGVKATIKYPWKLNKFYHLRAVFEGKKLRIYLNSKLVQTIALKKTPSEGEVGITAFRCRAVYGPLKITDLNGKVFLQEKWDSNKLNNWQKPGYLESIIETNKTGMDIFQIGINSSGLITSSGKYDFSTFKQRCLETLAAAPNAKIIVRMRLDFPEWLQKGRVECVDINDTLKTRWPWSFSSQNWKTKVNDFTAQLVKYIDSHAFGKRVIGFMLMSGHGGEFVYHFTHENFSDSTNFHRQAFVIWLKKKYSNDITKLNKIWAKEFADFNSIQLPTPRERVHSSCWKDFNLKNSATLNKKKGIGQVNFFPVSERARLTDFLDFHSSNIVDFIVSLVDSIKNNTKQKRIVGAYYGYTIPASSSVFNKGHNALAELLKSKIDFLCSPYNYRKRGPGGPTSFQLPIASASVNGKLSFLEDDTRTVYCDKRHAVGLPADARVTSLKDTIGVLKRNFVAALQSDAGVWYLDFGRKWFSPAPLPKLLGEFRKIYMTQALKINAKRNVEIVVLISSKTFNRMYRTSKLVDSLIYKQILDGMSQIGAPFDVALLSDLDKLKNYKFYVFLNASYLSTVEKNAVENVVKCDNKTALWIYAPGIISNKGLSAEAASKLTGIKLKLEYLNAKVKLKTAKLQYSFSQYLAPIISVIDGKVKKLGQMELSKIRDNDGKTVNGTLSRVGLAKKKFKNWTSIYCSVPNIPASLMRRLAKSAGVHIYNKDNNIIYAGSNWVAIHAVKNGRFIIKLPSEAAILKEMFTGKTLSVRNKRVAVKMKKGETFIWDIKK